MLPPCLLFLIRYPAIALSRSAKYFSDIFTKRGSFLDAQVSLHSMSGQHPVPRSTTILTETEIVHRREQQWRPIKFLRRRRRGTRQEARLQGTYNPPQYTGPRSNSSAELSNSPQPHTMEIGILPPQQQLWVRRIRNWSLTIRFGRTGLETA
jgi:hypothetical protein